MDLWRWRAKVVERGALSLTNSSASDGGSPSGRFDDADAFQIRDSARLSPGPGLARRPSVYLVLDTRRQPREEGSVGLGGAALGKMSDSPGELEEIKTCRAVPAHVGCHQFHGAVGHQK